MYEEGRKEKGDLSVIAQSSVWEPPLSPLMPGSLLQVLTSMQRTGSLCALCPHPPPLGATLTLKGLRGIPKETSGGIHLSTSRAAPR